MRKLARASIVAVALICIAPAGHAAAWGEVSKAGVDGAAPGADGAFTGKFELGYLATTGNADSASLNTRLGLGWEALRWRHSAAFGAVRVETDDVTTTARYQASAKSDYKFNEFDYLFVTVNYDRDEFAGYTRRTSEALGYGRRLVNSETQQLEAELGAGARQTTPVTGPETEESIARLAGRYLWKFSAAGEFSQTAVVERGEDNAFTETVTSLKAALTGKLGLKVSYTVKRNSDVPAGLEKTDTATAVGIEYAF